MLKQRIHSLDGLRALAALGVLWIHCWIIHGNPEWKIAGINLAGIMAIGGNGIDLFFVISGFCMYYFYGRKLNFQWLDFWKFIRKRWIRLSPAFYVATIGYIIFRVWSDPSFPMWKSLVVSLGYLNSLLPSYNAVVIFWTLGVEWQFYLIIPLVLFLQTKIGFVRAFALQYYFFLLLAVLTVVLVKQQSDFYTNQIIFRYSEFSWGVMAARMFSKPMRSKLYGIIGLIISLSLVCTGRILVSERILSLSADYYNFYKLAGFNLMGAGFGGIILLAVQPINKYAFLLQNRCLSFIGRISYSFYLWHGIVHVLIANWVMKHLNFTDIKDSLVTFSISFIILIPVSMLSYHFLEKPFTGERS